MTREEKEEMNAKRAETTAAEMKERAAAAGEESIAAEATQRAEETLEIDPRVDPRTHGGKRESRTLLLPQPAGGFLLRFGVALPVARLIDGTASMGVNHDSAFESIPESQSLLVQGPDAILRQYNPQFATLVFQDKDDRHPFQISEFEIDRRMLEQMALFDIQNAGGDRDEECDLALWYLGARVEADIWHYGLKGYAMAVGDAPGRNCLTQTMVDHEKVLRGVYNLPADLSLKEIGKMLLAKWHPFLLQVGDHLETTSWWSQVIGREHIVILPIPAGERQVAPTMIARMEAVTIGLTEGAFDLSQVPDYLCDVAQTDKATAMKIAKAVAHIPVGAQKALPNWGKLPAKGTIFPNKEDVWKIAKPASAPFTPPAPAKGNVGWKL